MMGTPLTDNLARSLDLVDETTEALRDENAVLRAERDRLHDAAAEVLKYVDFIGDDVEMGEDGPVSGEIDLLDFNRGTGIDVTDEDLRYALRVLRAALKDQPTPTERPWECGETM